MFRQAILGLAIVSSLGLAACASYGPTPYQPSVNGERGYSETKIETDRYRISFKGNSLTDKETVETYLLYRAAELTLQSGFDTFTVAHRDTDKQTRTRSTGGTFGPTFTYAYFVPRYGWIYEYDPFFYDPPRYEQVTRYEASAEILMSKGPKGANPESFDAHDVSANLGPRIRRPPQ